MSEHDEDEKLLDNLVNESFGTKKTKTGKEMSTNPKDMIYSKRRGYIPVVSKKGADLNDEWQELQRRSAILKQKAGLQGVPAEAIKREGNKLVVDENKIKQRKEQEHELIQGMIKSEKNAAKGVKHMLQGNKETILLKQDGAIQGERLK